MLSPLEAKMLKTVQLTLEEVQKGTNPHQLDIGFCVEVIKGVLSNDLRSKEAFDIAMQKLQSEPRARSYI